jgi:hypothetical protein
MQSFPGYEFTSPAEKFGKTFWRFVVLPSRTGDGLVTDYEWLNTDWNGRGVWYPSNEWRTYNINDGMFAGLPKTAVRELWERHHHEFDRLTGDAVREPDQLTLDFGEGKPREETMRSIIINAEERSISEAEIDGKLKTLQNIVGGLITPVYPGLEDTGHHAYVNDEGLLNNPQHFFMLKDGHQPLAGNGVILSDDGEGGEAPCTLPLDWVKERVAFMDLQAAREWVEHEPDQVVFESLVRDAKTGDGKAAKMEALAEVRADTEQSIAEEQERGGGRTR